MPDIRDDNVVELVASTYCANGLNKTQAMISAGYSECYSDSGDGQASVYGNERVMAAIAVIIGEKKAKTVATRAMRQEFWTNTMNSTDHKVNMGDKLRASELLGKSEADFTDNLNTKDTTVPTFTDEEEQALEASASVFKLSLVKGADVPSDGRTENKANSAS